MNLPWKRHESAMNLPWWNQYEYDVDHFEALEKATWKQHESAMKVPWILYEYDFEGLGKVPWICHESAMNQPWIYHDGTNMNMILTIWNRKVPGNFYEYVNLFISDNSLRLRESAMNLPWKRHESAMNLPWWNQYEYDIDHFEALENATWKRHESAMKVFEKCEVWKKVPYKIKIYLVNYESVKHIWNLHVRFMADSSRIHRGFMPVSFNPKKSKSCQIHVAFMAVSWHFHIQALPGYSLPKSIGKSYPKSRCWLSIWFFLPNFSFIFGNMSDSCRFHGPFMALSWRFLPSDFYCFFLKKIQTNNWIHLKNDRLALNVRFIANSSRIHGAFMSLSCQLHSYVGFIADSCHFHVSHFLKNWTC